MRQVFPLTRYDIKRLKGLKEREIRLFDQFLVQKSEILGTVRHRSHPVGYRMHKWLHIQHYGNQNTHQVWNREILKAQQV
jgi:hypothetical protein